VTCLAEFFEAWEEFKRICDELANRIAKNPKELERLSRPMNDTLCELGHFGEILLLYQQRLARTDAALHFIHYKEFIQHGAHRLHGESHPSEIRRLIEAALAFREELATALTKADDFIISRTRSLPADIAADFYLARDLYSVGFDDVAVLVLCRGLERVTRRILAERNLQTNKGSSGPERAHLSDVIETIGSLRWKSDHRRFISTSWRQMLHWMREIRNEGTHEALNDGVDPYELGPTIAGVANSMYELHIKNRRRKLESSNRVIRGR
jgi:hypothetical protein